MAGCGSGGRSMGFSFGLDSDTSGSKRKFRWLFIISGVSAEDGSAEALPPRRGARPSLGWKEDPVQHINETIYYPWKPDWKPVNLILFDLRCNKNPVFDWIKTFYNPSEGTWTPIVSSGLKKDACLELYDGCGNVIETWKFENCYPSNVEWGDLEMDNIDLVTVDVQLRYDRAFFGSCQEEDSGVTETEKTSTETKTSSDSEFPEFVETGLTSKVEHFGSSDSE